MIVQVVRGDDGWDIREVCLGTGPRETAVQGAFCLDDRIVTCWRRHHREYQDWCLLGAERQKARLGVGLEHLRWNALWQRFALAVPM